MDPILLKAIRTMMKALPRDPSITADDLEAYMRQATNNKYGYADAVKYLRGIGATQDPKAVASSGVRAPWNVGVTPRNMGRSFAQGALFNFGDEAMGLLPESLGGGEGGKEDMRLREDLFHQSHPLADLAGGVAGGLTTGLLLPGGAAATGAKVLAKGAAYGAGYGGLAGVGAGEGTEDRLIRGGVGAGLGAGLGAAIPGSVAWWRSMRNPAAISAGRIGEAVDNSGGIDKLLSELTRYKDAGKGDVVTAADLSPEMASAADFAANVNPNARIKLRGIHDARQEDVGTRMLNDTRDALTKSGLPPDANAEARSAAIGEQATKFAKSDAGYAGIEKADPSFDVSDLSKALDMPTVNSAWKAARLAGDLSPNEPIDQLLQAITKSNPGISPADAKAAADLVRGSAVQDAARQGLELNANLKAPTARKVSFSDLQQLAQQLGGRSKAAWQSGNGALGKAYADLEDQVTNAITKVVPNYPEVSAKYGAFKDLQRLVNEGVDWWNKADSRLLDQRVQELAGNPDRLTEFRTGIASELLKQLDNAATNTNVANRIQAASPAMQRKLEVIFGSKDVLDQYMEKAALEKTMSRSLGEATGGSQTARRNNETDAMAAGVGLLSHGVGAARTVGAHLADKAVKKAAQRNAGGMMGDFLATQGAPDIEKLLRQWTDRTPELLSPFAAKGSRGLTYGATQGAGSLFNMF